MKLFFISGLLIISYWNLVNASNKVKQSCHTQDKKNCHPSPINLPKPYGTCFGNNYLKILDKMSNTNCKLQDILHLIESKQIKSIVQLVKKILNSTDKSSSYVHQFSQQWKENDMKQLCSAISNVISPCAQALLPQLIKILEEDDVCCGELGDMLEMSKIILPKGRSLEQFILEDVLNSMNRFFCATVTQDKEKETCGWRMFKYIKSIESSNFRLLKNIWLPFHMIPKNQLCQALKGETFQNTANNQDLTLYDVSCCANHIKPLFDTLNQVLERGLAINLIDFFNQIVLPKESRKDPMFLNSLQDITACKFEESVCEPPKGLITKTTERKRKLNEEWKKRNEIKDVKCERIKKCDKEGNVCSDICKRGSVELSQWQTQALKYQRQLAFDTSICFAQLPATHNSAITLADGYGNRDQLYNAVINPKKKYAYMKTNNQMLSMKDQLKMGVRFLEIDVHSFLQDLYIAHCGGFDSKMVILAAETFIEQLKLYGTVNWGPELLGCFPSLSGIKADEQRKLIDGLNEVKEWLDEKENEKEFVFLYFDTGSELNRLKDKNEEFLKMLEKTFGNMMLTKQDQETIGSSWEKVTMKSLMSLGKRVFPINNYENRLMYRMENVCNGFKVINPVEGHKDVPKNGKLGNIQLYNGTILRSFESDLRQIMINGAGKFSRENIESINTKNIPGLLKFNTNLIAPDSLNGDMIDGFIWSWAKEEPKIIENSWITMRNDGKWYTESKNNTNSKICKACISESRKEWNLVNATNNCLKKYSFDIPRTPGENYALRLKLNETKSTICTIVALNPEF